jgi:hypothetical protein
MHRSLRTNGAFAPWVRRYVRRRLIKSLLVVGFVGLTLGEATAADQALEASTSAEARADAVGAISLKRIDPEFRDAVQEVLGDTSIFRRLPTQVVDCQPAMFTYLARNPEVLVEIWRELGITKVELERIDDKSFRMSDAAGTTGTLTIVEEACEAKAQNRFVMFAEGGYDGKPFSKPVKAQCVLVLRSGSIVEHDGRTYVAARLDSFIHIDRSSLEVFAKVVQPLVGRIADRNFADTISFVGGFSQAAEIQPARIKHLAESLENVSAGRKRELGKIAYDCHEQGAALTAARATSDRR